MDYGRMALDKVDELNGNYLEKLGDRLTMISFRASITSNGDEKQLALLSGAGASSIILHISVEVGGDAELLFDGVRVEKLKLTAGFMSLSTVVYLQSSPKLLSITGKNVVISRCDITVNGKNVAYDFSGGDWAVDFVGSENTILKIFDDKLYLESGGIKRLVGFGKCGDVIVNGEETLVAYVNNFDKVCIFSQTTHGKNYILPINAVKVVIAGHGTPIIFALNANGAVYMYYYVGGGNISGGEQIAFGGKVKDIKAVKGSAQVGIVAELASGKVIMRTAENRLAINSELGVISVIS